MLILAGTDLVGFASKTIKVGEQYFQPGYIKGSAKVRTELGLLNILFVCLLKQDNKI